MRFSQVIELAPGHRSSAAGAILPTECVERVGLSRVDGMQHVRVKDCKRGGVPTEADRDGADYSQREQRRPAESAQRVTDVLEKRLEKTDPAGVAALLLDRISDTKSNAPPAPRLGF